MYCIRVEKNIVTQVCSEEDLVNLNPDFSKGAYFVESIPVPTDGKIVTNMIYHPEDNTVSLEYAQDQVVQTPPVVEPMTVGQLVTKLGTYNPNLIIKIANSSDISVELSKDMTTVEIIGR